MSDMQQTQCHLTRTHYGILHWRGSLLSEDEELAKDGSCHSNSLNECSTIATPCSWLLRKSYSDD